MRERILEKRLVNMREEERREKKWNWRVVSYVFVENVIINVLILSRMILYLD